MKVTEFELKSIVLGRVDDLNKSIMCDELDKYLYARARLSEALTIAMQLNLIEPFKADEIGAKADRHICSIYNVNHIGSLKFTDSVVNS